MSSFEAKIKAYEELFFTFNKIHNLSTYKEISSVIKDSLAPLDFWDFSKAKVAADIGSGAGFPAVFLAMRLEHCVFHLFEPAKKKASFLSYAKASLKLENIIIHADKLEDCEGFVCDLITSRAAFKIPKLLELSKGYFDEKTSFLLYKGSSVEAELEGFEEFATIINQKERNFVLLRGLGAR